MTRHPSGLRQKHALAAAVVAALALTASACGSSGTSGSSASSSGSTKTSGAPIKIVSIIDTGPQGDGQYTGIQAAVKAINAAGGLKGRPIQLTRCDTARDPQQAAKCAQSAVSSKVVATVGNETGYASETDPVLASAGIPEIGNEIYAIADGISPNVFTGSPGDAADTFALPQMLAKVKGIKKIAVAYIDNQAGAALPALVKGLLKGFGGSVSVQVPISLTATNYTAQITTIKQSSAHGVDTILAQTQFTPLFQTMQQLGLSLPTAVSETAGDIPALQGKFPGIPMVIPGYFNHTSSGWQHFLKDMKSSGLQYTPSDYIASGWFAVQQFAYAVQHASAVTPAALTAALKSSTHVDLGGMTPPFNLSKANPGPGGAFPRIANSYYYPEEVKNGKLVSLNNWTPLNAWATK